MAPPSKKARVEVDVTCPIVAACLTGCPVAADSALKAFLREEEDDHCVNETLGAIGQLRRKAQPGISPSPEQTATMAHCMEPCKDITAVTAKHAEAQPLAGHVIVLLHHLTREVLGTIEALRQLGCRDVVCQFSGYNATAAEVYGPEMAPISSAELSAYKLTADNVGGKTVYTLDRKLLKRPNKDGFEPTANALDASFLAAGTYIDCARALASFVTLEALGRCAASGKKLLIVEDGGYVVPLLNDAALTDGVTVDAYRAKHFVPADEATDANLGGASALMRAVVQEHMVGSTEHTRNGYDKVQNVKLAHGKLAKPCLTIAISHAKTQIESFSVAATCLNSIESTLYSKGNVLRNRKACVLGSRGNIGGRAVKMLADRLLGGVASVSGVDIKVAAKAEEPMPKWQPSGLVPAVLDIQHETTRFADLPAEVRRDIDFIFGITGGPSVGADGIEYDTLMPTDVDFWLAEGRASQLWLASGSTKKKEFEAVQAFVEGLAAEGTHTVGATAYSVVAEEMVDPLTKRDFGNIIRFTPSGGQPKELLVIGDWKPVNFMFYGVPTEMIDVILAQLLDITVKLAMNPGLDPVVHAVDFDVIVTNDIVARYEDLKASLPLVAPGQKGW